MLQQVRPVAQACSCVHPGTHSEVVVWQTVPG